LIFIQYYGKFEKEKMATYKNVPVVLDTVQLHTKFSQALNLRICIISFLFSALTSSFNPHRVHWPYPAKLAPSVGWLYKCSVLKRTKFQADFIVQGVIETGK